LFRTEASSTVGLGHVMRCLSLATMLKEDHEISFFLNENNSSVGQMIASYGFSCAAINEDQSFDACDAVVLDGYSFKSEMQKKIKQKEKKLVFIDDLHDQHFYADIIINVSDAVSEKDYLAESYTHFCLGSKFALLRNELLEAAQRPGRKVSAVKNVFISMGGADKNNITLKALKSIENISEIEQVQVMIGSLNKNENDLQGYIAGQKKKIVLHKNIDAEELVDVLTKCELAICPASGTSMEIAAVGVGMISGITAENQTDILSGLLKRNCAKSIGDFNSASAENIETLVKACVKDPGAVEQMITEQKKMLDGLSPQRLKTVFKELLHAN
jgi:UDP-2,4-diacetamido-2,4,6-trideoxy-beta-L-altropyranose hydrolase